jgi:exopolysaccharide production protein ExoQ
MKPIATIVTVAFILLLLRLGRDRRVRTSWGLWIPILWFAIICSRPVSSWIHPNQSTDYATRFTESSPVDATAYAVLVLAGLLVLNLRAHRLKILVQSNAPVLLFFFYTALSMSWADDPPIAFKRWIKSIGDLIVVLVLLTEEDHEGAIRRMYLRVASVLLPLSVLFILYYPSIGTTYSATDHVTMYTGVSTFKNLLGITCMACGLVALWSLIAALQDREDPQRKQHIAAHAINLLLAVGLVLRADSMTSFSAFVLAGIIMVATSFRWVQRRRMVIVGLIAGVIGVAGFALFLDTGGAMVEALGRNPTLTGRTVIWRAVLAQKINPLIGAGFESFWMGSRMESVWSMSQYGIQEAHDGYLELYLNLGWVGIALLGTMIVTGYRNGMALFRRDTTAGKLRLTLLTAAVVFGFTEAGFRMLSPDWTGFLLAVTAVPVALEEVARAEAQRAKQRQEKRKQLRVLY